MLSFETLAIAIGLAIAFGRPRAGSVWNRKVERGLGRLAGYRRVARWMVAAGTSARLLVEWISRRNRYA